MAGWPSLICIALLNRLLGSLDNHGTVELDCGELVALAIAGLNYEVRSIKTVLAGEELNDVVGTLLCKLLVAAN